MGILRLGRTRGFFAQVGKSGWDGGKKRLLHAMRYASQILTHSSFAEHSLASSEWAGARRPGGMISAILQNSVVGAVATGERRSSHEWNSRKGPKRLRNHRPVLAIEQFEPRLLLSYSLTGDVTVTEGLATPYTLTLTTDNIPVESWTVNWGDGTTQNPDVHSYSGSQPIQSHAYLATGTFNISGTVSNYSGIRQSAAGTTVQVQPPDGEPQIQVQGLSASTWRGVSATNITLAKINDVYTDGVPSAYSATIDWGDGTNIENGQVIRDINGTDFDVVGSHPYAAAGNYQPTITVTHNSDSNAAVIHTSVQVYALQANPQQGASAASEIDLILQRGSG